MSKWWMEVGRLAITIVHLSDYTNRLHEHFLVDQKFIMKIGKFGSIKDFPQHLGF